MLEKVRYLLTVGLNVKGFAQEGAPQGHYQRHRKTCVKALRSLLDAYLENALKGDETLE